MGFMRKAAQIGTFGLAGLALSKKKRKPEEQRSLIASGSPYGNGPMQEPTSMLR